MDTTQQEEDGMSIEIRRWYGGKVIYTAEDATDMRQALQNAVLSDADLSDADLSGADLSGAVLSGAVLRGAVLSDADLSDADLSGAVLSGAVLSGAVLRGAVLRGADLSGADLRDVRQDLWEVLDHAPAEVAGLREKLLAGQINGSYYEGQCACLVGTLANLKGCRYTQLPDVAPDPNRAAEEWFMPIKPGDLPGSAELSEGSFRASLAVQWIDDWRESRTAIAAVLLGTP